MMKKPSIKNSHYEYPGYGQQTSFCGLEVYHLSAGRILAMVTEPDDNSGASITNRAEVIFGQLMREFTLDAPEKLIQIEHYGADAIFPEHWHRVTCETSNYGRGQYLNPDWEPLSYEEVQDLINS
jgi:hypothetical protein